MYKTIKIKDQIKTKENIDEDNAVDHQNMHFGVGVIRLKLNWREDEKIFLKPTFRV